MAAVSVSGARARFLSLVIVRRGGTVFAGVMEESLDLRKDANRVSEVGLRLRLVSLLVPHFTTRLNRSSGAATLRNPQAHTLIGVGFHAT